VPDPATYPNDWARLVGELTKRPGWSQAALAREAGVNRNTVRRWISGESANVSSASIRLLADAAEIDYEVAARAALGAQHLARADDDEAIRKVMESPLPDRHKREIVDYIHQRRAEEEAKLRRDIELMLSTRQSTP
jgi:transcriptional regulator with XRE-family HTH domain